MRPHRVALLETLLPQLAVDIGRPAPDDMRALFPVPVSRLALEIGFGGGENLVREALAAPDTGFIGCEPFINGMASALAAIDAHGLKNIRLYHGDAIELLDWLPAASIGQVDLLYPDPWPKKRHHKRRFVSNDSVARLARVVAGNGVFRFATDIDHYAEWTLFRLLRSQDFEWTAERADDWRKPWRGFAGTRYEAKAIKEDRTPCYLVFRRV
ncbi:MAG TPA: tRNA (guanosine(46)-N7)-methyltransferase TrmB [Xanthobacteraceae bacterium]|nr:tRNA (guanosine(46)-N7)-methyltransferase TrmB [Xanthobacteraceae bacterium]